MKMLTSWDIASAQLRFVRMELLEIHVLRLGMKEPDHMPLVH